MNSIFGLPLDSMRNSGLSANSTDTKPPVNAAVILFSALSAVIAIVNTLVIVVIWKDPFKELKGSSANYLILNLAICDLLTGFPGILLLGLSSLPLNDNLFYATLTCIWIPSVASILTIVSLAFERLIVVSYPVRSADYLTIRCFKVWITLIWTAAVFPASFVYMGSKTYYTVVAFIWADVAGVVIILLLLACYIRIYMLVRKTLYLDITTVEERRAEGEALTENARRKTNARKKERKVLRTVLILTAVFLTCWIPDFVVVNLNKGCNCFKFPVVQGLLVTLPPLLNPLCYALCTAKFRRALLKIWSGLLDHKSYYTFRC